MHQEQGAQRARANCDGSESRHHFFSWTVRPVKHKIHHGREGIRIGQVEGNARGEGSDAAGRCALRQNKQSGHRPTQYERHCERTRDTVRGTA